MAGSIKSCPACKSLLLRDTVQCPECDHVLDAEAHQKISQLQSHRPGDRTDGAEEICPTCEEKVRHGMVRCWNCGSFMRDDIGELYMKMQAKPAPIIYSNSSDGDEIYTMEDAGDAEFGDAQPRPAAEDDFELSPEIAGTKVVEAKTAEPETYAVAGSSPAETKVETAPAPDAGKPAEEAASTKDEKQPADGESGNAAANGEKGADSAGSPESHSVATGGDALLQIALEEELESDKRRRHPKKKTGKGRTITGFLVFCANGHRIEVQDRHRGKAGRCPRCKSLFIVPEKTAEADQSADADQAAGAAAAPENPNAAGRFTRWMNDVHIHKVNPEKLRLKAGSLEKAFELVELGFSKDDILIASLPAPKGLFGLSGGGKKNDAAREALLTALREETPLEDVPVAEKRLLERDALTQLMIDQPVVYEHESMFVGIPVFGPGRIAVRLPKADAKDVPTFLSFDLSGFRQFSKNLDELYEIEEFGAMNEIPLTDEFTEQKCHYSEETFRSVEHLEFYQHDSAAKLKLVGRKCAGCGLVVSEDSRKKEKIGGANGKGIAKAKCPKCMAKFGDISLFDLEAPPESPEEESEKAEEATASASTAS